ncbi:AIP3-domain-containing protein [Saitoella complicata NRRL Y-17804]|nr:AIP3-domain-containing protein [Saitoella complicata NRRL Y-17804]ODQ54229.1 AIP3-domain-containing protein [Saitoella complicata NRRL Y-17804]
MELNRVVAEQGFLRQQEALLHDHKLDVQATREVVNIIDACVAAFAKQASPKRPAFIHTSPTNSLKTRDALLTEVRAKQPDHESRIDAIARAEAVRQKELEARIGEFEKELGDFVTEGKLKKTGGADEVERMRAARDELVRKAAFTKQAAVDTSEKEFQKEEEHVEAIRETPENAENPRNEDDDEGSASNAPSAEAAVTEETLVIEESLEDAPGAFPTEEASATAALSSAKESIEVPGPLNRTITEDGAGDVFMTPSTELTPAISADATSHPSISNVNEVEGHEAQNGMTDVEGTQSITEIENSVEKSVEEEGMEIPTVQVEQGQEDDDDEELR